MSSSVQPQHQIEQRPVANRWTGRFGRKPVAIVEHTMQGTLDETFPIFNHESTPAYDLSAHYGVGRDGRIVSFVAEEDTAWANGVVQDPDTGIAWLREAVEKGENLNTLTVSIEYEGYGDEGLTEEQYAAALWLHQQICQRWAIAYDADHIIGHNRIDSHERADSPGVAFPWHRLLYDLSLSALGHSTTQPAASQQPAAAATLEPEAAWHPKQHEDVPVYLDFGDGSDQQNGRGVEFDFGGTGRPAQSDAPQADLAAFAYDEPSAQTSAQSSAASFDDIPAFAYDEPTDAPQTSGHAAQPVAMDDTPDAHKADAASSFGTAFDDVPPFDFGQSQTPKQDDDMLPFDFGQSQTPKQDDDMLPFDFGQSQPTKQDDAVPSFAASQNSVQRHDDLPSFDQAAATASQPAQSAPNPPIADIPSGRGTLFSPDEFDELPDFLRDTPSDSSAYAAPDSRAPGISETQAPTNADAATQTSAPPPHAQSADTDLFGSTDFDDLPDFLKMDTREFDAHDLEDKSGSPPATPDFGQQATAAFPAVRSQQQSQSSGTFGTFGDFDMPDFDNMGDDSRAATPAPAPQPAQTAPAPAAQSANDQPTTPFAIPEFGQKAAPAPIQSTAPVVNEAEFAGIPNVVHRDFGPVRVQVELANIRDKPSYDPASIIRVAKYGDQFTCDATGEGPELFGRTTWYHVRSSDGGGWVHSALVDYV